MADRLSFRRHPVYKAILWIVLAGSLFLLWQMNTAVLSNSKYIPVDDFAHYWAAGRLNFQGLNPYDPALIQELRDEITGSTTDYHSVPINWTPPWSLFLLMPYGILDYPLSRLAWLITQIALIFISANLTWKVYGGDPKRKALAWGIAFVFGPTISVLEKGQITPLVLSGIVCFLYFSSVEKHPWLAGLSLLLISLKPQLFFLFWPAVLLWIIMNRAWRIALGALGGLGLAFLAAVIMNPPVVMEYLNALMNYPPTDWATPTLGGYLRLFIGIDTFWLQFVPMGIGLAWFLSYWKKHYQNWDWHKAVPALLFISILTTPYGWTYDQVILLPAVLLAGITLLSIPKTNLVIFLWGLYLFLNGLDLFLHRYYDEFWFLWVAPSFAIWFLLITYTANRKLQSQPST